jgi:sterol 3beta-glucosyltransferase
VINNFRKKSLGLKPLSLRSGPLILERLRIPTLFCWSNTLIPKPRDWAEHIDVTGFLFLKYPSFQPPADLKAFLDAGSPPIYIGCARRMDSRLG